MKAPVYIDFESNKKGELFLLSVKLGEVTTTYILDDRLKPLAESKLARNFNLVVAEADNVIKSLSELWNGEAQPVGAYSQNERHILKGITGYVEPRHMLAIMGPSGCGKSTLLDTLAGRLASSAKWEGEIRVNGHKSKLSYGRAAYVTQDEVLIGTLTVEETLLFAARLRLPLSMSTEEKRKIVSNVINELGLDSVKNTYIGNWHSWDFGWAEAKGIYWM